MRPYEIGLYEKAMPNDLSLEEKLLCAKELGYDYLELSIDETDEKLARLDWTQAERDELKRAITAVGLNIGSICLSGHRKYPFGSKEHEARAMEIMEKAIQLAADLGVRVIQLAGYDVYYEKSDDATKSRFLAHLKEVTHLAARAGVVLGFETMETSFMDTVWKSMFYVQAVNSPYLGVYPDTGNLTNASKIYKTDPILDLKSGSGHIVALHLKETIPGHYREIPFGTGHVDFKAMTDCAWDMGIRRYVTEMWYVGQEDWKEDILKARTMMCGLLGAKE